MKTLCYHFCTLQTLPAMQHQVQLLEEKYKDIAQLKNMKDQIEGLKKERVWAEVIEAEKVHALRETVVCQTDHCFWLSCYRFLFESQSKGVTC